jgi:hypothetical protein
MLRVVAGHRPKSTVLWAEVATTAAIEEYA